MLLGDSALIVNQANRKWRCKSSELQAHFDTFQQMAAGKAWPKVSYIRRAQNLAGIALKNLDR
jgi:ribonuclease HI